MAKKLISALFLLSALSVGAQSQDEDYMTYYSCDFNSGMPDDMTLIDNDRQELHFTMVQAGFDKYDSWRCMHELYTENDYAASASRHKQIKGQEPRPASDWMVTPQIWIRGSEATITWRSMSVNENTKNPSSYCIMVSTTGNTVEDFTEAPLMTIDNEPLGEWTEHRADLGSYVGRKIYIAFVNTSLDGEILAVDDIEVAGLKGLAGVEVSPGEFTTGDGSFPVSVSVSPTSSERVTSIAATCEVKGKTLEARHDGLNLGYHEDFTFTFAEEVEAEFGEKVEFDVTVTLNGKETYAFPCTTTMLAFVAKKNIVIEESTGMWCIYCPKGILAFEILEEKYPDNFIGIAVHIQDEMQVGGYSDVMTFPEGAPTGWINRDTYCKAPMVSVVENGRKTYTTMMGGFESYFLEALSHQPLGEVTLSANVDGRQLSVATESRFAIGHDDADMRLLFVVTEDHVWKEGYYQLNKFSGGDEILGGYENLPASITTGMEFNHVARAIYNNYDGIAGSLPAKITPGESYGYTNTFRLPKTILDNANINVIAMIVDAKTGKVVNSATAKPHTTAIATPEADGGISVDRNGSKLTVCLPEGEEASVRLCDMSGRTVIDVAVGANGAVDCSGLKGVFVLKVDTPTRSLTRKLVF